MGLSTYDWIAAGGKLGSKGQIIATAPAGPTRAGARSSSAGRPTGGVTSRKTSPRASR